MLQAREAGGNQVAALTWEVLTPRVPLDRYEALIPQLTVISPNDIPPNLQITSIGVVGQ